MGKDNERRAKETEVLPAEDNRACRGCCWEAGGGELWMKGSSVPCELQEQQWFVGLTTFAK